MLKAPVLLQNLGEGIDEMSEFRIIRAHAWSEKLFSQSLKRDDLRAEASFCGRAVAKALDAGVRF